MRTDNRARRALLHPMPTACAAGRALGRPIYTATESMNGARLVHDILEKHGWDVSLADAQKVKGLAPLERLTKCRRRRVGGESRCVHFDCEDGVQIAKPLVSDELWELIEPLIPKVPRRHRFAGRKRLDDRRVLTGILFVLRTGIPWEYLPQEMGCGSGMTCWRRLQEWQEARVWQRLHELLLAKLNGADRIDWSRAAIDSSHVRALGGAPRLGRARSTAPEAAPSTT